MFTPRFGMEVDPLSDFVLLAEERLPVRWAAFDYSAAGAYYVTIVIKNRQPVLGELIDGQMVLSEAGIIADRCLREIPVHYPTVMVNAMVVMPDHVHAILVVSSERSVSHVGIGHARSLRPGRPFETLPVVVGTYKSSVSRLVRAAGFPAFGWQKSYHDRIIRDQQEYDRIRAYIETNPRRCWEKREDSMRMNS